MTLDQKTQQELSSPAYESGLDHLADELRKLDMMIRLRVAELRHYNLVTRGVLADPQVAISHEEVDALLGEPVVFGAHGSSLAGSYRQIEAAQEEIDTKVRAGIERGTFMALPQLAHLFALSRLEMQAVLICLAPELDRKYDRLYAYLQDDITRKKPSVDLVLNLIFGSKPERWAARPVLSNGGALLRTGILSACDDPQSPSGTSGLAQFLKLDQRVLRYLLGDNSVDGQLREFLRVETPSLLMDDVLVDSSIKSSLTNLVHLHLSEQDTVRKKIVLYFNGPNGVGKRELALGLCHQLGTSLLRLDAESLMVREADAESLLRLVFRESLLLQAPVYFNNADALFREDDRPHPIMKTIAGLIDEYGCLVILGGEKQRPLHEIFQNTVFQSFEIPLPGVHLQEVAWQRSLDVLNSGGRLEWAPQLASRFRLTPGQIRNASALAGNKLTMNRGGEITLDDLYQACRNQSNDRLGELASKTKPHYTWDDLVLPESKVVQLREICSQIRNHHKVFGEWGFDTKLSHGKGVSVLFSGPPGTGKTMGAEVIANDLGVDLYKVDLSGVVSKYIGETEKNLAKIFNESEASNAILFFDEADALFGKRTEVSDAHDRYANIETSYLLQKMEEYQGIVILATNLRENMDEAFTRRIRFIVEFPFPDMSSRLDIWKKHFPAAAPLESNLDYEFLSKEFAVAGGSIKNIVLNSAFFAAEDGGAISMKHIMHGARREYEKIGKSWNEPRLR